MKVLMPVLHYYPVIGGLEAWTQNIAERLSQKAEIFVVTSRVGDQPKSETKNGVRVFRTSLFNLEDLSHSALIFILGAMPFIFLKSLFLIIKEKIGLLHCQGFLGACLGYCLSKITLVPYIVTIQRLEGNNLIKKAVYRNAGVCIAASSAIKKYFEEIGCKNIEVIPNGVDLRRFENLKHRQKDGFIIMTVARLEKVKGIKYLIEAINILCSNSSNIELLIIGDGAERKNLENLIKELKLEERVKFVGQIPPEGIPEYLAMADCFVLPSLKEGFGIAILEAMAASVPVIATRVGGILDIIEDGKTGILVEPQNSEEISLAIAEIYNRPEIGRNLVNSAIAELSRYDWENIAEKVHEIYRQIISRKIVLAAGIFPPDIGGPATYIERLADELSRRGFEIRVITYADKENSKFKIQNSKFKIKIQKVRRDYPWGLRHFLYFWKLIPAAKDAVAIYAQNMTSAGLPAVLASRAVQIFGCRRPKAVMRIAGNYAWEKSSMKGWFSGGINDFEKARSFRIMFLKKAQAVLAKMADAIVVPCHYLKDSIENWGVSKNKIKVIYNTADDLPYLPLSRGEAQDKIGIRGKIILSVGRLDPWKGFISLVEITADLIKNDPDFKLLIAGDGDERRNIESKIADLNLQNNVKLLGKIDRQDLPVYLKAADVFVLNSAQEGFSHVILEAMCQDLPVIASNEGGNPELIEQGVNGILVKYNDKNQIKEAIIRIVNDQNLRQKFIENSKIKLRKFTSENLLEQTIEVLQKTP